MHIYNHWLSLEEKNQVMYCKYFMKFTGLKHSTKNITVEIKCQFIVRFVRTTTVAGG